MRRHRVNYGKSETLPPPASSGSVLWRAAVASLSSPRRGGSVVLDPLRKRTTDGTIARMARPTRDWMMSYCTGILTEFDFAVPEVRTSGTDPVTPLGIVTAVWYRPAKPGEAIE